MSPFVELIGALLTFLAFWEQLKANDQQRRELKPQETDSEKQKIEGRVIELNLLAEEIVENLESALEGFRNIISQLKKQS